MTLHQFPAQLWRWRRRVGLSLVVILGAVCVLVLELTHDMPFYEAVYETLKIFLIDSDFEVRRDSEKVFWFVWAARFVAPALLASGLLDVVLAMGARQRVWFGRGHVLVAGLGSVGVALCEEAVEAGLHTVAIELDEQNPNIDRMESLGVQVLIGDATHQDLLRRARIHLAARLYAVTGHDLVNVNITAAAIAVSSRRRGRLRRKRHPRGRWMWTHVYDRSLRLSLDTILAPAHRDQMHLFNSYQVVARELLERNLPSLPANALVVVAGLGRFGRALVAEMLQGPRADKQKLLLVDPLLNMGDWKVMVFGGEHGECAEDVPMGVDDRVFTFAGSMLAPEMDAQLELLDLQGRPLHFLICTDHDLKNMHFVHRISRRRFRQQAMLVVRLFEQPTFVSNTLVGHENGARTHFFCTNSLLVEGVKRLGRS